MITMKPIQDAAVLEKLGKGLEGADAPEGYIISDGAATLGYALYYVHGKTALLLRAEAEDAGLLDGVLRASLSQAEEAGAEEFAVVPGCAAVEKWAAPFLLGKETAPLVGLFGTCCE